MWVGFPPSQALTCLYRLLSCMCAQGPAGSFNCWQLAPYVPAARSPCSPSRRWLSRLGGWRTIFYFNWVIIVFTAVFGFGMGGYASIKVRGMGSDAQMRMLHIPVGWALAALLSSFQQSLPTHPFTVPSPIRPLLKASRTLACLQPATTAEHRWPPAGPVLMHPKNQLAERWARSASARLARMRVVRPAKPAPPFLAWSLRNSLPCVVITNSEPGAFHPATLPSAFFQASPATCAQD